MSSTEKPVRKPGRRAAARGPEQAATALGALARRTPELDRYVTVLLEVAADAAESHVAPGAMPQQERRSWEAAGARFDDPDAPARSAGRATAAFASLLERSDEGDQAVAERLGVDRTRVSQRVGARSLYAVTYHDERYYPRWQFDGAGTVRGLKDVLNALDGSLHPLTLDHWMTTPNVDLDVGGELLSPVDWLRTGGDVDVVVALAEGV